MSSVNRRARRNSEASETPSLVSSSRWPADEFLRRLDRSEPTDNDFCTHCQQGKVVECGNSNESDATLGQLHLFTMVCNRCGVAMDGQQARGGGITRPMILRTYVVNLTTGEPVSGTTSPNSSFNREQIDMALRVNMNISGMSFQQLRMMGQQNRARNAARRSGQDNVAMTDFQRQTRRPNDGQLHQGLPLGMRVVDTYQGRNGRQVRVLTAQTSQVMLQADPEFLRQDDRCTVTSGQLQRSYIWNQIQDRNGELVGAWVSEDGMMGNTANAQRIDASTTGVQTMRDLLDIQSPAVGSMMYVRESRRLFTYVMTMGRCNWVEVEAGVVPDLEPDASNWPSSDTDQVLYTSPNMYRDPRVGRRSSATPAAPAAPTPPVVSNDPPENPRARRSINL